MVQKELTGPCRPEAGKYLRQTTRREFLLVSSLAAVASVVGCGKPDLIEIGNENAGRVPIKDLNSKKMGVEDLRGALWRGLYNEVRYSVFDNTNIPDKMVFLGRPENVVWAQHTEGEILSFLRIDNGKRTEIVRDRWPKEIAAWAYSISLVIPKGIYGLDGGLAALLQKNPRWNTREDLTAYARTMLKFDGFYITERGRQNGANLLTCVSVTSHDRSLPEGRLNGIAVFIYPEGGGIASEVESTPLIESEVEKVKKEYPFKVLARCYRRGIDIFAKMDKPPDQPELKQRASELSARARFPTRLYTA